MDVEENPCKFSGVSKMADQYPENDDDDEDGVSKIRKIGNINSTTEENGNGGGELVASRLRGWHNSSRIFRVSRASGGKDRHSKVLTSKGLRDRRVRLSVSTAISFYDLQDRLGYDQPSKAVEWLIKAADDSINELPSLNTAFSDMPLKQFSSSAAAAVAVAGVAGDENEVEYRNYQQQISACSSTSETSKGSGLSVSRSDANVRVNREKARERARERASKEKESEAHNNSSFTELLNAGINKQNSGGGDGLSLFRKSEKQWQPPPSMDYFTTTGLLGGSSRNSNLGFSSGQIQLGNNNNNNNNSNFPQSMMMMIPPFSVAGENHSHQQQHNPPELQHFSFMPNTGGGGNENYNLNFSPSSTSSSGFNNNRGTLQSNSSVPSSMLPHHHLQRFSSIDGSSSNVVPFFMAGATSAASSVSVAHLESNNHQHYHQFGSGFDGSLQLYHGDGTRDSDHKGKGKN